MLLELHVSNFALIDRLDLTFGPGLNILTGETGAGKSIIIDALGLTLGERASGADLVRTGAERASVEAVFRGGDLPAEVVVRLDAAGIDCAEEETLIVSREIVRTSGKSQCRVNGRLVPVAVLKEIGDRLVDVHGQHEHQSLLDADKHIDIVDAWCGPDALALRADVESQVSKLAATRRELEGLRTDARERVRSLDLYRFQIQEIDDAALTPGEEEDLVAERTRLMGAEKLSRAAVEAYAWLSGSERGSGALDGLNAALAGIEHTLTLDESLQPIVEALRGAAAYAEDAAAELRHYSEGIEFNPERIEEIETRLELLRVLRRKYGATTQEVIAYRSECADKLDVLENSEAREAQLEGLIAQSAATLEKTARKLQVIRRRGCKDFAAQIASELGDLGMLSTKFEVSIQEQPVTARGTERIEFLISPNPGEPLRPLAKIASGGEMSRIMLAMKSVLVRTTGMGTMIFDEIDVGIGGRTAQVIASKLAALGSQSQILCITHLPQIAALPGTHFLIEKRAVGERTLVSVTSLGDEARVDEIVRMLGGNRRSEAVVQHAREMLTAR